MNILRLFNYSAYFLKLVVDQPTDQPTDLQTNQQTDMGNYRAAIAYKKHFLLFNFLLVN